MDWAVVAGTRPQFIKAAALLPALRARGQAAFVHTGQHRDAEMAGDHFADLGLDEPDHRLEVVEGSRPVRLAAMIDGLARVLEEILPGRVIVFGDTDTTLAGALAASAGGFPVAHVEAGARCGNRSLPEEQNRIVVDELSDLLFCSTEAHARNLVGRSGVFTVGDVMADVLFRHADEIRDRSGKIGGQYAVLTMHRAATADDPAAIARVLEAASKLPMKVFFPIHPRTKRNVRRVPSGVEAMPPLTYLDFLGLVAGAQLVLTDSGGLQKEAYLLGVPCITLREETEWEETIAAGWNSLAGTDPRRILIAARQPPQMERRYPVYGDGHAARNIADRV